MGHPFATTIYTLPIHTTVVGTDHDTYFPDNDYGIYTKGASSLLLITRRELDTGTCTFQVFGEFFDQAESDWLPWLDLNNATQIQGVLMADTVTNAATPYHQFLLIREAPIEVDADAVKIINTVHKAYQSSIPARIRWRFRHAGTTVSNRFSAQCTLNTPK